MVVKIAIWNFHPTRTEKKAPITGHVTDLRDYKTELLLYTAIVKIEQYNNA